MTDDNLKRILLITAHHIIDIEGELNRLDKAIGDGDHGSNMSRGARSLIESIDDADCRSLHALFNFIGSKLLTSIGGASGALYGSLFSVMGDFCADNDESYLALLPALEAGANAVKELGCSDVNQKTMLDVIVPTLEFLKKKDSIDVNEVSEYAKRLSDLTIGMRAEKGRASFLGERSIGHLDPGARSSQAIISSICNALI